MTPVITLAAVAVGVIILGLVVASAFLGGGSSSAVAYLPHESEVVGVINVPAIVESGFFGPVRNQEEYKTFEKEFEENMGLRVDEVASVWFATPMPQPGGDLENEVGSKAVFVVETTRAVDPKEVVAAARGGGVELKEEKVGEATVYCGADMALAFPQPQLILGGKPEAVRAALSPSRKTGLNDSMQDLMGSLDSGRAMALVGLMPEDLSQIPGGGAAVPTELAQQVKALTLHADFGADLLLELVLVCKDADTAESLSKMSEGLVEMSKQNPSMPEEVREMINSFSVKVSGTEAKASIKIPGKFVNTAIENGVPMGPLGGSTRVKKMPIEE